MYYAEIYTHTFINSFTIARYRITIKNINGCDTAGELYVHQSHEYIYT